MVKTRKNVIRLEGADSPIALTVSNKRFIKKINEVKANIGKMYRMRNGIIKLDKFNTLNEYFEQIKKSFNEETYSETERDLFSTYITEVETFFSDFTTKTLPELKRRAKAEAKIKEGTEAKIKEETEAKIKEETEVKKPRKRRHSSKNHSNVKKIKL